MKTKMMKKFAKHVMACVLAVFGCEALAATRTYVGASGGYWGTAANWQDESGAPGVPQANDTLVIGTSCENDLDGLVLTRIEFAANATATLTGNSFSLSGITDTDAGCALFVPSTTTVDLVAPISSADANITIRGGGVVNQRVSFTEFAKQLKPRNVYWHIWNCSAFGSDAGEFVFSCDGGGLRLHNATVRRVYANADRGQETRCAVMAMEGDNIVGECGGGNGNYPYAAENATLTILKSNYIGSFVRPWGSGRIIVSDNPWKQGFALGNETRTWGTVELNVSGNVFSDIILPSGATLQTGVADALGVVTGTSTNSLSMYGGTLDLAGNDQSTPGFCGAYLGVDAAAGTIRTTSSATLTIVQDIPQYQDSGAWLGIRPYGGGLDGALSIAKEGSETTVVGGKNSVRTFAMDGSISVSEGTLGLVKANFTDLGGVAVGDASILAVGPNVTVPAAASIALTEGAQLDLAGDLVVASGMVTIGGRTLADGTYGSSDSAAVNVDDVHFIGTGMLVVGSGIAPSGKATAWTGGASAKWSDPGNWSNGVPGYDDTVTIVPGPGVCAITNDLGNLVLRSFSLTVSGDFELAGGRLIVTNGWQVATEESATPYEVSFDMPLMLHGDQVWTVAESNATVRFRQGVTLATGATLTKEGMGAVRFDAPNTISGKVTVNYGKVLVYAAENGLGDGTAPVEVFGARGGTGGVPRTHDAELVLCGASLGNQITLHDGTSKDYAGLRAPEGVNVISGMVNTSGSWYPTVGTGATLAFRGGVTSGKLMRAVGKGTIRIENTPVTVSSLTYFDEGAQDLNFVISTNVAFSTTTAAGTAGTNQHIVCRSVNMRITTTEPYVFDSRASAYPGNGYLNYFRGTFDLSGNSQCIGGFGVRNHGSYVKPEDGTLVSSTPATLELYQHMFDRNPVYGGKIEGQLSILKSGQYPLTLGGSTSDAVFTTSGDLSVTQGVLTVNARAKFSNLGALRVSGTGTINLMAADNLPTSRNVEDLAELYYDNSEGATISVTPGVLLRVKSYTLNGVPQHNGVYSFDGGQIQVGKLGLIIVVR